MAREFRVLNSRQVMNINPAGTGFNHDWEVMYEVTDGPAKGSVGTVTVPASDYNADYVDGAIREQMSNLHAVHSLGESS